MQDIKKTNDWYLEIDRPPTEKRTIDKDDYYELFKVNLGSKLRHKNNDSVKIGKVLLIYLSILVLLLVSTTTSVPHVVSKS